MIFILTKLLNFFTSPINWIILFLILWLTVRNKLYKKLVLGLTIVLSIVFTNGQLNLLAVRAWSAPYIRPPDSTTTFEIAIVLGGSTGYNPELQQVDYNSRGDRMTEAIRLYRLGRIKKLYLTGESAFMVKREAKCYAPDFLQYMKEMGVDPKDILLEQNARSTRENILNLQKLLGPDKKGMPCLLITSGWHMRRAMKGFNNSGLILVPYAVDSPGPDESENWYDYLPSWRAAMGWQELIHEIVGLSII